MQQENASFGAIALRRGFEDVDELHQRHVESEDSVATAGGLVEEEVVARELLLVVEVFALTVRGDHVVDALEGGPRDLGALPDDLQVVLETPLPGLFLEARFVLHGCDF